MVKLLFMVGWLGIPGAVTIAQVASGSPDLAPWITAGAVLTLSGLLFKIMREDNQLLRAEISRLNARLDSNADEDRRTIVPVLARATDVLANFVDQPRKD